jgi:hypothetical protein
MKEFKELISESNKDGLLQPKYQYKILIYNTLQNKESSGKLDFQPFLNPFKNQFDIIRNLL